MMNLSNRNRVAEHLLKHSYCHCHHLMGAHEGGTCMMHDGVGNERSESESDECRASGTEQRQFICSIYTQSTPHAWMVAVTLSVELA